jgi:hypothetical protein
MAICDLGENKVIFEISRHGKIKFNPQASIISTSREMQTILEEILPKVAKYFEELLREELMKRG